MLNSSKFYRKKKEGELLPHKKTVHEFDFMHGYKGYLAAVTSSSVSLAIISSSLVGIT